MLLTGSGLIAGIVLVVALVVGLKLLGIYNRLVRERNGCDNAFSTIDVQLKMRCDLIPKLVDAVRGYMTHERGTLEALTDLRSRASAPGVPAGERVVLDAQMSGLLTGLFARVEAYPDLKSNQTVLMLQRSLNEVEAQIAAARRAYNAAVTVYNTSTETVPSNLVAGMFGFARRPLFEAATADRGVPTVPNLAS
jgi:LemA protein